MLARGLLAAAATAALLVAPACGGSDDAGPQTGTAAYDKATVERLVADDLRERNDALDVEGGRCPRSVDVKIGQRFRCKVDVNRSKVDYRVTPREGDGDDRWEVRPEHAVVDVASVEEEAARQAGDGVTAHCGAQRVQIVDAGSVFGCRLEGSTKVASVKVTDLDGNFTVTVR